MAEPTHIKHTIKKILDQYVICDMCGRSIKDDEDHNAYHKMNPHPSDMRGGLCVECVDYANHMAFDQAIEIVQDDLNEINKAKFMSLPFGKQCWIILKLDKMGAFKWTIG